MKPKEEETTEHQPTVGTETQVKQAVEETRIFTILAHRIIIVGADPAASAAITIKADEGARSVRPVVNAIQCQDYLHCSIRTILGTVQLTQQLPE